MRVPWGPIVVGVVAATPALAAAHGMRSAYLEVTELPAGHAVLRLSTGGAPSGLRLAPPAGCRPEEDAGAALLRVACDGGLAGRSLRVEGVGPLVSEVVVQVTFLDGATAARVLTAAAPSWVLPRDAGGAGLLGDYVRLGVVHILTGFDHLLFLAALAVALRRLRAILIAESAFTASHTITFTAAALGWIRVSSAAAEACIAMSLVLVALDAAAASDRDAPAATARRAAPIAFAFGLVHGLGFAGGLAEIGLPDRGIAWALAGFAGGVEVGQVVFLLGVVTALALARRAAALRRLPLVLAYGVGSTGAFLFLQRLVVLGRRP